MAEQLRKRFTDEQVKADLPDRQTGHKQKPPPTTLQLRTGADFCLLTSVLCPLTPVF